MTSMYVVRLSGACEAAGSEHFLSSNMIASMNCPFSTTLTGGAIPTSQDDQDHRTTMAPCDGGDRSRTNNGEHLVLGLDWPYLFRALRSEA